MSDLDQSIERGDGRQGPTHPHRHNPAARKKKARTSVSPSSCALAAAAPTTACRMRSSSCSHRRMPACLPADDDDDEARSVGRSIHGRAPLLPFVQPKQQQRPLPDGMNGSSGVVSQSVVQCWPGWVRRSAGRHACGVGVWAICSRREREPRQRRRGTIDFVRGLCHFLLAAARRPGHIPKGAHALPSITHARFPKFLMTPHRQRRRSGAAGSWGFGGRATPHEAAAKLPWRRRRSMPMQAAAAAIDARGPAARGSGRRGLAIDFDCVDRRPCCTVLCWAQSGAAHAKGRRLIILASRSIPVAAAAAG